MVLIKMENNTIICAECGRLCKNMDALSKHITFGHKELAHDGYTAVESYYRKHMMKPNGDKCIICGKQLRFHGINKNGYGMYCSAKCAMSDPAHINKILDNERKHHDGLLACQSIEQQERKAALQSERDNSNIVCAECGMHFITCSGLSRHILQKHANLSNEDMPVIEAYYRKHVLHDDEDKCAVCGSRTAFISMSEGYRKFCSCTCKNMYQEYQECEQQSIGIDTSVTCEACKAVLPNKIALKAHILNQHADLGTTARSIFECYYRKYLATDGEGKCERCGKPTTFIGLENGYKTLCISCIRSDNDLKMWSNADYRNHMKHMRSAVNNKINASKRRNGTFNSSKKEMETYHRIKQVIPDLEHHYRDLRYANNQGYKYECDYYSPSLDLFIEYNNFFTHHNHIFNWASPDDVAEKEEIRLLPCSKRERWKGYLNVWLTDAEKYACAHAHCLNYVVLFDDIDVEQWTEQGTPLWYIGHRHIAV